MQSASTVLPLVLEEPLLQVGSLLPRNTEIVMQVLLLENVFWSEGTAFHLQYWYLCHCHHP